MREPAKLESEEELYAAALRALTRRAHSVFEMRGYLEKRAADPAAAKSVLARLRQSRLLDDARYAADFARFRAQTRRQGRYRIARELRARGVSDAHIDAALQQTFAGMDERAAIQELIRRKMRAARAAAGDSKQAASLYRALLRSGFDAELVRRELQAAFGRPGPGARTEPFAGEPE